MYLSSTLLRVITQKVAPLSQMGCEGSSADVADKKKSRFGEVDQNKVDQAILDLKVTRDRLKKYQNKQERTQQLEMEKARELVKAKQVEKAKFVLRQKKMREKYIANAQAELENVERMIDSIETKQMEMEVIKNLEKTNNILKQMNELMPVEEVERLMDENEENAARLNEVSDILARNMSQVDQQECEDEYERMLAELEGNAQPGKSAKVAVAQPESGEYYSDSEDEKVAMPA